MNVGELIEKLRQYPQDADLDIRDIGAVPVVLEGVKLVMIVSGSELDPLFQIKPPFQRGFGKREAPNAKEKEPG